MNRGFTALPARPLVLVTATVLLAHLALLHTMPTAAGLQPAITRPFITRSIELRPPAPMPPAAAAAPAPLPRAPRAPPVAKPNPPAAQEEQSVGAMNSVADPTPEPPAPAAAAQAPAPPAPPPREDAGARATAFSIPGSVRLHYNVMGEAKKHSYSARAELLWLHDGSSYSAKLGISAFLIGSRNQTSVGRITALGLEPTRFADKSRSELAAHFDYENGKVSFSANTPDAALLTGAQDRLSLFMQLAAMFAGEPARYPAATTITVQAIGPREADTWLFTVEGEETLSLPSGTLGAWKLIRNPRREHDLKVELWLAPALDYLPARIRLTQQNGDFVDQQLRAAEKP